MMDGGCCRCTVICVRLWILIYCVCVCVCVYIIRLLFIDTEFRTLRLKVEDSSERQHVLTVRLKSKVRNQPHIETHTHTEFTLRARRLKTIRHQMEYTPPLDVDLQAIQSNRSTSPHARWMFNLRIAKR